MPPAGESSKKEGFVAKAAGVAVVGGIAWSILKSFTSSSPSSSSSSSSTPPSLQVGACAQTYNVSQGDTLFSISQRFGVSLEALKAANRVHEDDIFAGDKLVIPN